MKAILKDTEYQSSIRVAVKKQTQVVLLLVKINFYEKLIQKGTLTHTDLLKFTNAIFKNYGVDASFKNRSKSILSLIYGSSSKINSQAANKIYEQLLSGSNYDLTQENHQLPELDPGAFRSVIEFLRNNDPSNSDYSLKLAISIFDVDVSAEALLEASKRMEKLEDRLDSLRKRALLMKEPSSLILELEKLEKSIAQVKHENRETANSIASMQSGAEKSEKAARGFEKKTARNALLIYIIIGIAVVGSIAFFLIKSPMAETITMLDIEMSSHVPIIDDSPSEGLILQEILNETESINSQILSFKLSNYSGLDSYFVDAISLQLVASPSRVPSTGSAEKRPTDSVHFLLNQEATYYSIKIHSDDKSNNHLKPKTGSFFSLKISGSEDFKNLEFTFEIIVEGHDSSGNSFSVSSPNEYSITFK